MKVRAFQIIPEYHPSQLKPALSVKSWNLHYATLYRNYVRNYNLGKGDPDFNEAGAYLHGLYFNQLKEYQTGNLPSGNMLKMIKDKYGTFTGLERQVKNVAETYYGSGWIYLSTKDMSIKTIDRHQMRSDIGLIIDWWEHAWLLDYGADKMKYLNNFWNIVDWSVVEGRFGF